LISFN